MAYGATEPAAGSDLGRAAHHRHAGRARTAGWSATSSTARKQWISNGGVADVYTHPRQRARRARRWFVVEKGHAGLERTASPRTSTASAPATPPRSSLDDVCVDADRLVGGVEGQGLLQAQAVFGYTRLMVAAFGLGAGWAALDRAIPYSTDAHPGRRRRCPRSRATRTS